MKIHMKQIKKLYYILLGLFSFASVLQAQSIVENPKMGVGVGYNSFLYPEVEAHLQLDFTSFSKRTEVGIGLLGRSYNLDVDRVLDLKANSIGLFGDIAIYPFDKHLFAGLRWELVNLNWFNGKSKTELKNEGYTSDWISAGTGIFLQVGTEIPLSSKSKMKLFVQPGVLAYDQPIGDNSVYVQSGLVKVTKAQFICNVNLAFEFAIGKRR